MFFLQAAAKQVTNWLIRNGGISEKDREIYEYGFDNLFSTLTNFIIVICIGWLLGIVVESIIFYVTYFMLRVYAGGYHADSPMTCFFLSIVLLIPYLLAIKYQHVWNIPEVFFALLVGAVAILIWIAPVGTKNKMLDDLEKTVYRRRLFRNLTIVSIIGVILFMLSLNEYYAAILCGILLTMTIALAGKIKLSLQG